MDAGKPPRGLEFGAWSLEIGHVGNHQRGPAGVTGPVITPTGVATLVITTAGVTGPVITPAKFASV